MKTSRTTLTKADIAMFARHKVPVELLEDARVCRVTDPEARRAWHVSAKKGSLAGIVFPYPSPEDEGTLITCRIRRDTPEVVDGKTKNKYMQPAAGPRCLYRPPGAAEKLREPGMAIVLVEAEKSALAIEAWTNRTNARQLLPLAMGGCWGWSQDKKPMPDLEAVCRGRAVTVLLDANADDNPDVRKGREALTASLQRMGCSVLIADLPQDEGVNGPDDLLAKSDGDQRLADVLDNARPAVVAPHSDDALAARFAEQQQDDVRNVVAWGRWYLWDKQRWKEDETQTVASLVQQMCEEAAIECGSIGAATRVRSARTRAAVQQEAAVQGRLAATTEQWDADPWLLNTPGGVVDLRSGKLRPAARADYCTKLARATPEKKEPARWRRFLNEITDGDVELQKYLQRVCGYCLTGSVREEVFFFYGTGANGKSKFANALRGVLGDYAQTAPMETFMATHNPQHPTDLAGLRGARLVTASEVEDGQRWAESKLKLITGGDRIKARFMRQDFFEYTPQFKPMIFGNYKPRLRNVDKAMQRRIQFVPFTVTIPDERREKDLDEQLRAELGGVLQWAIEGCIAWQKNGLRPPASVTKATQEYLADNDTLGQWVAECCEKGNKEKRSELYQSYRRWAEASGTPPYAMLTTQRFAQQLEAIGHRTTKVQGDRYVGGLRLQRRKGAEGALVPINRSREKKFKFSP